MEKARSIAKNKNAEKKTQLEICRSVISGEIGGKDVYHEKNILKQGWSAVMGSKLSSRRNRCAATYVFVLRHPRSASSSCSNGELVSNRNTTAYFNVKPPTLEIAESKEVLNQCVGDIEAFIHQMKMALGFAENKTKPKVKTKKLSSSKNNEINSGKMMPVEIDIINLLKRVKQAINCIAHLRFHLYEPNAPEMTRRLFAHLDFINRLCKTCPLYTYNLPSKVILPLLSCDAVRFLKLSLMSHEMNLWTSLGKAWTIPRNEWRGGDHLFNAVLLEGWEACYPGSRSRGIVDQPWMTKMTKFCNGHEQRSTEMDTLLSEESNRSLSTPRSTFS